MKPIVLTGMPGSGKTTAGKIAAKTVSLNFFDIDEEIEKSENMTISEIFAQKGEEYFRITEALIIKKLLHKNSIISLGGGSFENQTTRDYLLKNSVVIYLETTPETLYQRLKNTYNRPLLTNNPEVKIKQLLNNRQKNYKLAQFTVLTDNKTTQEVAKEILKCVNLK